MQSTPRPQRKAAAKAAFNMATAGVPDRDSRPTKPPQAQAPADPQPPHVPVEAPKEPAVLHATVEAPKEPAVLHAAGRQKKPLPPKPVLSVNEQVDKMSVMKLKDYIEAHGLKLPKNPRKSILKFNVLKHMKKMEKPKIKKVPHVWVGGRKKVKPNL
jgi:hypothetical protein